MRSSKRMRYKKLQNVAGSPSFRMPCGEQRAALGVDALRQKKMTPAKTLSEKILSRAERRLGFDQAPGARNQAPGADRRARCLILAMRTFGLFILSACAVAQTFEVASVKPNANNDPRTLVQFFPGGGLRTSGATVKGLISLAYDVHQFRIMGGPGWMETARFDIDAKPEGAAIPADVPDDPRLMTLEQRRSMQELARPRVRALLEERFQLKIHREARESPVYALVIAKSGSKLQADGNATAHREFGLRVGRGELTGTVASLEMLTTALSNQLGRPVVDRTGLSGTFDYRLTWTPDSAAAADSDGPSLFTAIQEQLGLRLEAQKAAVEMIIVDRVERPSGN
jgi:bla regulator protein blaR1